MTAAELCLFVIQEMNKIYCDVYKHKAVNDILTIGVLTLNDMWLELDVKHQAHVINLLSHISVKTMEKVTD